MKATYGFATAMMVLGLAAANPALAGGFVQAEGEFTVDIDFSTLTLTPVNQNCLIKVEGVVNFTGTLDGIASAGTRALASASCEDVATLPPGAYEDVFTSALEFAGTINGEPIVTDISYRGKTHIGGDIDAVMVPSNGLRGRLSVDATVAAGGTYRGLLVMPHR